MAACPPYPSAAPGTCCVFLIRTCTTVLLFGPPRARSSPAEAGSGPGRPHLPLPTLLAGPAPGDSLPSLQDCLQREYPSRSRLLYCAAFSSVGYCLDCPLLLLLRTKDCNHTQPAEGIFSARGIKGTLLRYVSSRAPCQTTNSTVCWSENVPHCLGLPVLTCKCFGKALIEIPGANSRNMQELQEHNNLRIVPARPAARISQLGASAQLSWSLPETTSGPTNFGKPYSFTDFWCADP